MLVVSSNHYVTMCPMLDMSVAVTCWPACHVMQGVFVQDFPSRSESGIIVLPYRPVAIAPLRGI